MLTAHANPYLMQYNAVSPDSMVEKVYQFVCN
nr:MAG TPA: hypothetical protein [Caudoviricetes sp.]